MIGSISLVVRWHRGTELVRQQIGSFVIVGIIGLIILLSAFTGLILPQLVILMFTLFPILAVVAIGRAVCSTTCSTFTSSFAVSSSTVSWLSVLR